MLIEGRHFRREWSAAYDIGRKAAAQNFADVAAMGAVPTALFVGAGLPGDLPVSWLDELADGLTDECAEVGAAVAGGDLSRSDTVFLGITAVGDLQGRAPVTRSGARQGDVVAVCGTLGHAAAGLALLRADRTAPASLIGAHRRPRPPYDQGPAAAVAGATAMIDISDGLVQDLGHIASASGVGLSLDVPPVSQILRTAGADLGVDPREWVLTGGDDHALAATFSASAPPPGWRVIGRVLPGQGVLVAGKPYSNGGWDHFR